jgi:hypothetical protein
VSCDCYAYDAGEVELDPMFGQLAVLTDISFVECCTVLWCATVFCCTRCVDANAGPLTASAKLSAAAAIGTLGAIKGILVSLAWCNPISRT